ncbi:MAG: PIN domain-containing protein [Candidatus Aminicenantes bacterium]|nr:PIN domain-containing protein [Candidatus Aminicenantes bacterium]MDH5383314.1 PIN domain-containing protein [Candidatus Aminicenantes bacterium]MDH5743702.1 PIN domain-containing protein [Candidatus Aminicenantes bacterium]
MKDKVFLDTNIIVYAHDRSSGEKHAAAKEIMDYLWESRKGVISVQVLQEFFVCVTKKIIKPLHIKNARMIIEYLFNWDVVVNDKYIILKAIDLKEKYRFSFWDSLVIQAAIQGQARILLSEDLPDGQVVKDLKIVNPFTKEWKDFM